MTDRNSAPNIAFASWPMEPLPIPRVHAFRPKSKGNGLYVPPPLPWSERRQVDVPDELYLREFMSLNTRRAGDLLSFMSTFGFFGLREPAFRTDTQNQNYWALRHILAREAHLPVKGPKVYGDRPFHIDRVRLYVHALRDATRVYQLFAGASSLEEFAAQAESPRGRYLVEYADDDDERRQLATALLTDTLEAGLAQYSVRIWAVPGDENRYPRPSFEVDLFGALCAQLFNHIQAHEKYHICRNESCRRLFVHQRGRANSQHRSRGVDYCSRSCAWAQLQRERRRRIAASEGKRVDPFQPPEVPDDTHDEREQP